MQPEEFDLVVVGGGKAGKTLAVARAAAGERVAMVERAMIGGSCINVACIPTKALVTSARALATFARAERLGIRSSSAAVDLALLRAHKEGVVADMVAMNRALFAGSGMDFILGAARFVAPRTIEVSTDAAARLLRGRAVVVNTGTRPSMPPIAGLAREDVLSSEDMLRLDGIPKRLVVVGGGFVGCEFAQMFARFGSEVTMLVRGERLLAGEEAETSAELERAFAADGIQLRFGAGIARGRRAVDGSVELQLEDGSALAADVVLMAVGREPVTDGLGLDVAGVEVDDRGFVVVDDYLATGADGVWAVGDVVGHPQFTHLSYDDFRVVHTNIGAVGAERRSTRGRVVPSVVFVEPEIATVGMTEKQALDAGHDVVVAGQSVLAVPRSRTLRQSDGFWKIVIDRGTQRILGASLVGIDSAEVIAVIQTAMLADAPYTVLRDAIFAHPTMAEGLTTAFARL